MTPTAFPDFYKAVEVALQASYPDQYADDEQTMAAFERGLTVEQAVAEQMPFVAYLAALSNADCPTFNHRDARKLLVSGIPAKEAAVLLNAAHQERLEGGLPFDPLDHDLSMNG